MTLPLENNINTAVKKIAAQCIRANKGKSAFIISAIVLTTVLFAAVLPWRENFLTNGSRFNGSSTVRPTGESCSDMGISIVEFGGTESMSILQTIDLKKYYGAEPNITRALDGVSLSVEQGEFVAVVGTSGSGKSTLLHMMGGLDTPTSGSVMVRGEELAMKTEEQLTIFRRRNIGFVFQNYNLVPILNVYENIVLPVELDGDRADQQFLDEIVHMLALEDKLNQMPNNLSGGQQQRVAIARALITKPAIVLADEPTGNLDSKTSADVLGLLKRTGAEFHQTIVMITHNNEIAQLADRIVRIEDGRNLPVLS